MKRLLFLLLTLVSSVTFGQRYVYSRATPGGSSAYQQLLASDVPSNFLRSNATNTMTGNTTIDGAFELRFGNPLASSISIVSATTSGGFGWTADATGLSLATSGSPATGALFYRNSSGYTVPLNVGSNGQFLTLSGGLPAWATLQNAAADGATKGIAGFNSADFDATSGIVSFDYTNAQKATTGTNGILTSVDWNTFNNKVSYPGPTSGTTGQMLRWNGAGTSLENFTPTTDPGTTVGDILYLGTVATPNVYNRLAGVATGNALISGGVGAAPSWGKIDLTAHVSSVLPLANGGTGGSTGLKFNNLIAADGTNTINHGGNAQTWQWNTLAGATGILFQTTSTAAASDLQTLVNVVMSGANANAGQQTFPLAVSNTHTGTTAENEGVSISVVGNSNLRNRGLHSVIAGTATTNVAGWFNASGGTNNYAGIFESGFVGIGTTTPTRKLQIDDATTGSLFSMFRAGTEKYLLGISGTTDGIITGTLTGDVSQRTNAQKFAWSTDNGTTMHMALTSAGSFQLWKTITASGTTGAQTINKPHGVVNFAASASTLVVTNSLVTTSSNVFVQVYGTDVTATSARVTLGSGSFTITLNAAATAETAVGFFVLN